MHRSTLTPVFTGLRVGLHALLVGLAVFAAARAYVLELPAAHWVLVIATAFVGVYVTGAIVARRRVNEGRGAPVARVAWVLVLTALWGLLTWLSPEGAYLVFPLFFLYLHVLPSALAVTVIVVTTGFAVLALGLHHGFNVGGVVGPLIGAGVALLIGLAYRALVREAEERERLLAELLRTREQLADTEREQGALTERARLARDIHDTVAQGLSSIQMLLHAAERDVTGPSAGYLQLARETAADSLAETRQIIRELTPSRLDDGLAAALRRLGEDQSRRTGLTIEVAADDAALPMDAQIALFRIAQGALSNVFRHAAATEVRISLQVSAEAVALTVRDDGVGFDVATAEAESDATDSFGLSAMRERVEQLGGRLEITSVIGGGTTVIATLDVADGEADA